jgi:hypothetical protein
MILTSIKKLPDDDHLMIETCWSDLSVLMCDIWNNVLLQTSALVGPLHVACIRRFIGKKWKTGRGTINWIEIFNQGKITTKIKATNYCITECKAI